MRTLQLFNWLIFALSVSISFVLWVVIVLYLALGDEPSIQDDWPSLLTSTGLFTAVALASGLTLWGHIKQKVWRWFAQAGLLLGLASLVYLVDSLRG